MSTISRRNLLFAGAAAVAALPCCAVSQDAKPSPKTPPFRYGLNFGTLRGFKLSVSDEIDVAAKAGYQSIEPWAQPIGEYLKKGGKLADLKKQIDDHGLIVEDLCAFFPWIVDDDAKRREGIEQMQREMDWANQLGCSRIAATCAGATDARLDDFRVLGDRYRTILEIGDKIGVIPQLEIWGKVKTLNSLADALAIAAWAGHPKAELLLDVFHLYRGGSPFEGLAMLNGRKMNTMHVHDYPADPPREKIEDRDRVYCGDGIAPLKAIFRTLCDIGFAGCLSFEVFNPSYWATGDPLLVAKTGLEKMKAAVENAFA